MRKKYLTYILAIIIIGLFSTPILAMSFIAEDFVQRCHAIGATWPPAEWDKYDLRDAANEVLTEIENGNLDMDLHGFCITALGSVGHHDDFARIISYNDQMPDTVTKALSGFSHPDAVNFLFTKLGDEEPTIRELAAYSLSRMDFTKFDKPMDWYDIVRNKLVAARDTEEEQWLLKDFDKCIDNLKEPPLEIK